MIKLAVFDMDGTLLNDNKKVLGSTLSTLQKLRDQGIKLAIASGRPFFKINTAYTGGFDFDYLVCCNGNGVYDYNGNVIFQNAFPKHELEALVKDFQKDNNTLFFQFQECSAIYSNYEGCYQGLVTYLTDPKLIINETKNNSYHLTHSALQGVGKMSLDQEKYYVDNYKNLDFIRYGEGGYDIVTKGVNKATGVKHICNHLGITMDEVIAFGDYNNDVKMIQEVGIGVAMGNSLEVTKKVADYITKSNNEDAIEYACKYFNLI